MQAGIGMSNRSFKCVLCGRTFTRFGPDAFLHSENLVCDDCLTELRPLEQGELRRRVSARLVMNPLSHGPELAEAVIRLVNKRS